MAFRTRRTPLHQRTLNLIDVLIVGVSALAALMAALMLVAARIWTALSWAPLRGVHDGGTEAMVLLAAWEAVAVALGVLLVRTRRRVVHGAPVPAPAIAVLAGVALVAAHVSAGGLWPVLLLSWAAALSWVGTREDLAKVRQTPRLRWAAAHALLFGSGLAAVGCAWASAGRFSIQLVPLLAVVAAALVVRLIVWNAERGDDAPAAL